MAPDAPPINAGPRGPNATAGPAAAGIVIAKIGDGAGIGEGVDVGRIRMHRKA